jgi:DNA modification methylase
MAKNPFVNRIIGYDTKPADQFQANPANWRKHPQRQRDAVNGSLRELGWIAAVVENVRTGHLVDGHERVWQALANNEDVPYLQVDLSEAEEKLALSIFDPITYLAETDAAQLDALLQEVSTTDAALQTLLAELAEDAGLYQDKPIGDAEPQIDRADELRQQRGVESGQLWTLGEHRLICGDCTDADVVARLMGGEKADMVFTDPPYNVDIAGGSHDPRDEKNYRSGNTIDNDRMTPDRFYQFLLSALKQTMACMADGAACYVCFSDMAIQSFVNAYIDSGFRYSQMVVWVKQQMVFGRWDYHSKHEQILYGWKPGAAHYFVDDRTQDTVWEIDRPMRSENEHPTQKPTMLYAKAIANSSKMGGVTYEPFCGTGTALIACENLGRKCRAVEISPAYVAVALQRWADLTGKTPQQVT